MALDHVECTGGGSDRRMFHWDEACLCSVCVKLYPTQSTFCLSKVLSCSVHVLLRVMLFTLISCCVMPSAYRSAGSH